MSAILDTIIANWQKVVIPLAVAVFCLIALFWLRRMALHKMLHWAARMKWSKDNILLRMTRGPSALLCIILSAYLGITISSLSTDWKHIAGNLLWTLFIVAVTVSFINLAAGAIGYYGRRNKLPENAITISRNVVRVVLIVMAILIAMGVWGVPTSPILLVIAVLIVIAILAFRDSVPDLFAGLQIVATQEYKTGDYIKLDSREEGYITEIKWNRTTLKGLDGGLIQIPNQTLLKRKVINYGHPLKKARAPFKFKTRSYLPELTGLKARTLNEFVKVLKDCPETIIYYHTHHFLEEHHYLVPDLTNDFASWVKNTLDNQALGERLSIISTRDFENLLNFRDKVVNVIETYLAQNSVQRYVPEGREFYFIKSVDVILPTAYSAGDLREFVEALRQIAPGSLYYHVFASRIHSENNPDNPVVWLAGDLDEKELANEIARIDPYTYTLEGLRSLLIQTIEKHIK